MNKIMVCLIVLFLLMGISAVPLRVHGDYTGNITINSDGSVSPSDAPILSVDNITYTFTSNITGSLAVQRNNTIIDGNGFMLDTNGAYEGISLINLTNIVIKNTSVKNSFFGIELDYSFNCTLSHNDITNAWMGFKLYISSGNTISENNIITNRSYDQNQADDGIGLGLYSANNIVFRNKVSGYYRGIDVSSDNNTVTENIVSKSHEGIEIFYCSENVFSENYVGNNEYGVRVYYAPHNILTGNTMQDNGYDFGVEGAALSDFMNSIDTSNLVNGKHVYYLINQSNIMINPEEYTDAGYLGLANCVNVTVQGFTFRHEMQGILFAHVNDSRMIDNNLVENYYGIDLAYSCNNTLSDNNVTASHWDGMYIERSFGNRIFHDNFVDNSAEVYPNVQIYSFDSANAWDDGYQSGGNYWSSYDGKDNNQDGIGDTPYIIDANNADHYPLMGTFQSFDVSMFTCPIQFEEVDIISNSTIGEVDYWFMDDVNSPTGVDMLLRLTGFVGQNGTVGFCRITFPNDLINSSSYPVITDLGQPITSKVLSSNGTHTTLYFTYDLSITYRRDLYILPEFPSFLILLLFSIATLLTVIVHRRNTISKTLPKGTLLQCHC